MICQCGPLNFLALTSSDSEVCCDKTFSCNDFSPTLNTQKAFVGRWIKDETVTNILKSNVQRETKVLFYNGGQWNSR